ncbi:MAG: ribosome biogenesis GTP-binding protein YihA/YsxC [Myxococcota bacterium]|nr:ribosome biogenesis GTP-binding protein YihA/YsxC [Myxococcota bacterium]
MRGKFILSSPSGKGLPQKQATEIAIFGRSNVGKSSLIASLTTNPKIVKVSSRPGKTQCLNYYAFGDSFFLVDFPGYGYAKVSKQLRASFKVMINSYLMLDPPRVDLILLLIDSRREKVSQLDVEMLANIRRIDAEILIVATKIDTIAKNKRAQRLRLLRQQLKCEVDEIIGHSSKLKVGNKDIYARMNERI